MSISRNAHRLVECCRCLEPTTADERTATLGEPAGEETFALCVRCYAKLRAWLGAEESATYPEPDSEEANPDER